MNKMPLYRFIEEYKEAVEDTKAQAEAQKKAYRPPKYYGRKGGRRR